MVKVGASPSLHGGHVTQVWPIRAQYLPGRSEWLRTGHLTQIGPIKVPLRTFAKGEVSSLGFLEGWSSAWGCGVGIFATMLTRDRPLLRVEKAERERH